MNQFINNSIYYSNDKDLGLSLNLELLVTKDDLNMLLSKIEFLTKENESLKRIIKNQQKKW